MKNIILSCLLIFSTTSSANNLVDISKLSQSQISEINSQIRNTNKSALQNGIDTISSIDANKFEEYGPKLGKGITGFVKEIGISIEEFSHSEFGKLSIVLLAIHFFGKTLLFGSFCLFFSIIYLYIWFKFTKSSLYSNEIFTDVTTITTDGIDTVTTKRYNKLVFDSRAFNDGEGVTALVSIALYIIIILIAFGNMI